MKAIVCVEYMADGPMQFAVDSRETFDAILEINEQSTNEASAWGGFEFDIDSADEELEDFSGYNIDPNNVDPKQVITMEMVAAAKAANNLLDGSGSEQDHEDAIMYLLHS